MLTNKKMTEKSRNFFRGFAFCCEYLDDSYEFALDKLHRRLHLIIQMERVSHLSSRKSYMANALGIS